MLSVLLTGCSSRSQINSDEGTENKVTTKIHGELDGRGFMSPATDSIGNGIAFKENHFIWKYGYPVSDDSGIFAIMKGNYSKKGSKIVLTNISKTNFYQGKLIDLQANKYSFTSSSEIVPSKVIFKLSKNNKLHLKNGTDAFGTIDMIDYGTSKGTPNFNAWDKKYSVSKIKKSMSKMNDGESDNNSETNESNESSNDESKNDFDENDYADASNMPNHPRGKGTDSKHPNYEFSFDADRQQGAHANYGVDDWLDSDDENNYIPEFYFRNGKAGFRQYLLEQGLIKSDQEVTIKDGDIEDVDRGLGYYVVLGSNINMVEAHVHAILMAQIPANENSMYHTIIFGRDRLFYTSPNAQSPLDTVMINDRVTRDYNRARLHQKLVEERDD